MDEERGAKMTASAHMVVAVIAGWLSILVGGSFRGFGLGVVLLLLTGYVTARIAGKRGTKFWAANGIVIFVLFWLVSWIYFLNTLA